MTSPNHAINELLSKLITYCTKLPGKYEIGQQMRTTAMITFGRSVREENSIRVARVLIPLCDEGRHFLRSHRMPGHTTRGRRRDETLPISHDGTSD